MKNLKRKCKVVMLATDNKINSLKKYKDASIIFPFKESYINSNADIEKELQHFHLYIISDDEIGEGDYQDVKVIASTDKSLGLPQPSKSFIDKYITEYNKGNIIEDVLVEYCLRATCDCDFNDMCKCGDMKPMMLPKISKDNTITISKVKNQFSFKEVELILSQFICEECPEYSSKGNGGTYIHNWIKENLEL